jgi:flagellar basal-body rod modification protein FlgD
MAIGINKVQTDPALSSNSKYSDNVIDKNAEPTAYMDFDSYLKLLAAQMSNQDFNNPMSDSEFLAQMASYSTLEAIKNMSTQSALQYGASLTGKTVTVSDGSNYEMGIVDSVTIRDGKAILMINGNSYESDKMTDVVSDAVVAIMNSLKGVEVSFQSPSDGGKGVVTGGLVANGIQHLILDGNRVVQLQYITLPSGDNAQEAVDDAQKTGETDLSGVGEATGTDTDPAAENAVTDGSDASQGTDNDGSDIKDGVSAPAIEQLLARSGVSETNALTGTYGGFYLQSDTVEETRTYNVENLAAPVYSENTVLDNEYSTQYNTRTSLGLGNGTISMDDYLQGSGQATSGSDDDEISIDGGSSVISGTDELDGDESVTTAQKTANAESQRFVSPYENTIYTNTNPGLTYGDGPYYRKYAYEYPEEAAMADAYGTRMFDIRYITNTAITSRIDTSTVIGHSASGRELTEIGFSGKGKLGEVNTYSDGTQRVEVIFANGDSGWYYTSGRYTIDQITNRTNPIRGLTPDESDIRHFASKPTAAQQASMDSFEAYLNMM